MKEIDLLAKFDVEKKYGLPYSLHVPIAARDKSSITRFIGDIVLELSKPNTDKAFLISVATPPDINSKLAIWKLERSEMLHKNFQVWVDVSYHGYRKAYIKGFPNENIDSFVLDHAINRRIAALKGFRYVRLIPVSREVNSSSAFSEKWGVAHHGSEHMQKVHRERKVYIQYADTPDILNMLNIKPGGGVMNTVRDADYLWKET